MRNVKKKEMEKKRGSKQSEKREKGKRGFSFISKIYGNRIVGFRQSKKQSRATHRELRVGTKILEFRQTSRGREFSYLGYF